MNTWFIMIGLLVFILVIFEQADEELGSMTEEEFDMFPKATGDYEKDCDYIFLKQIREANQRFVDPYETVTHNED